MSASTETGQGPQSRLRVGHYPKVAILVLNHNGLRWLPKCLSSVAKTHYPNCDVFLIDNGSVDGSVKYVRETFPHVKIISLLCDLGFAGAYNEASEKVDADLIVLLNNDTEVLSPNWVELLIDAAGADPGIAAVACKMVSMDDHSRLDSVGGMGIPFWRGFVDMGKYEIDCGQYDSGNLEPFAFCGGAALLRKEAFLRAGGFDGRFFLYTDDADLSWRLRLFGYRIRYAAQVKVAHYYGGTAASKTVDANKLYYSHRNLLRAIIKNCGSSLGWALRNYLIYTLILGVGFSFFQPEMTLAILKGVGWNLLNLRDTYKRRLRIQSHRTIQESEILAKMYPARARHQPSDHAMSRRILNTLFEHAQRHILDSYRM